MESKMAKYTGNSGDDLLIGSPNDDIMIGAAGNDILKGGSGDDRLNGGAGDDVLWGGEGNNMYVLGSGRDTIVLDPADLATSSHNVIVGFGEDDKIGVIGAKAVDDSPLGNHNGFIDTQTEFAVLKAAVGVQVTESVDKSGTTITFTTATAVDSFLFQGVRDDHLIDNLLANHQILALA